MYRHALSRGMGLKPGLLSTAVPFGVVALFAHQHRPTWVGIGMALILGLACTIAFWRLAVRTQSQIA